MGKTIENIDNLEVLTNALADITSMKTLPSTAQSTNGYYIMPSGLILQWGYNNMSVDVWETVPFNTDFPNAVFAVYASTASDESEHSTNVATKNGTSLSSLKLYARHGADCYWFAIGY